MKLNQAANASNTSGLENARGSKAGMNKQDAVRKIETEREN